TNLHLAAELGKTLLERNKELEDSLQQMYITNEEQVQEIERVAAVKASVSVFKTSEVLYTREKYKKRRKRSRCSKRFPGRYEDEFVVGRAESFTVESKRQPYEEDNQHLREAVSALRAAVRTERGRREGVERECNLLIAEFSRLQTRVQDAESCQARVRELEVELQELQQLRRARTFLLSSEDDGVALTQTVLSITPETDTFLEAEDAETGGGVREEADGGAGVGGEALPESSPVRKSCSDTALNAIVARDASGRRRGSYAIHANSVRKRGMSILREVDEQYHVLLEKYEELLGKCRRHEESLCHAGVQTSRPVSRDPSMKDCAMGPIPAPPPTPTQSPSTPEAIESISKQVEAVDKRLGQNTPEYKALFKEIFSRIQKTKMDIKATKAAKVGKSRGKRG
uniref:Cerebellar deration related protein 2 like n=1 Tax=Cyprinodon variegatus TaxID=28743 RepID=A0A3Q2EA95_CYPVA